MTSELVVAGLCEVHGLVIRDEEFALQVSECADNNALVLSGLMGRLKAVEALVI